MTPSRDLRPTGIPYSNGEPNPLRCELWHWTPDGKHEQCPREGVVDSLIPGRIPMRTCATCHQKRMKEKA